MLENRCGLRRSLRSLFDALSGRMLSRSATPRKTLAGQTNDTTQHRIRQSPPPPPSPPPQSPPPSEPAQSVGEDKPVAEPPSAPPPDASLRCRLWAARTKITTRTQVTTTRMTFMTRPALSFDESWRMTPPITRMRFARRVHGLIKQHVRPEGAAQWIHCALTSVPQGGAAVSTKAPH